MPNQLKEFIKTLEFPFCYYAYIIDREGLIDYLHYGLWEEGTYELKEAQENLASLMKSLIPDDVKKILDVGCGLGRTTYDLTVSGLDATGISPDARLVEMAKAKYRECESRLVLSSFEDYGSVELFDLILFQESAQYIKDINFLFSRCKELLNKRGYVLICDEIRYGLATEHAFHEKNKIVKTAREYGFTMMLNKDITKEVLETRDIALKNIIKNKDPLIREFSPVRENAGQEIESLIEGWKAHSAMFEKNMFGYEIFLFQKGMSGTSMPPRIRLYEKGDEAGITRLFKEIFQREMTLEEWRWKYTGRGNKKVYSAVAVSEMDGIIAHYGGMPHRMIYQGREIYGLAIGDVMVHPKLRGLKLFKKTAALVPEEAVKDGIILGYGFPNERALLLPQKLGLYEKVEDVFEATKEVKFHNTFNRYLFKFSPLSFDDNEIDALWERVKHELRLAVVRDRKYLKWRYQFHPFLKYELWGLKNRFGNKLRGIAVLRQDRERMLFVDFISAADMIEPLFLKAENYASAIGKKFIVLWHPEYLSDRLLSLGFSVKPSLTCIPRTTHELTLKKEDIKGNFFYTMGDTDFL